MVEGIKYKVERPIYSYEDLSNDFIEEKKDANFMKDLCCKKKCRNVTLLSIIQYILPFPFELPEYYTCRFLLDDVIAGLTLFIFHIPQGMAFGLLAGLQPINGLYTSFFSPLMYIFFGTSRHISVGTFSIMSLVSSVCILREATQIEFNVNNLLSNDSFTGEMNYEMTKLQISVATSLLAGIIQFLMGLLQLGCIMNYVNHSLIGGFTTATAFHIIVSQLPEVFGYPIQRYSGLGELPYKLYLFCLGIKNIHWITMGMSTACVIILLFFSQLINPILKKKIGVPIPIQLIILIFGTMISHYLKLSERFSVRTIGYIPKGLPDVMVPNIKLWPQIFADSFLWAIFGFIISSALVKIYCVEFNYEANFNQELLAYGLGNIVGSFFQCIMSSAAMARSAVAVEVGMKSQVASMLSCILMLFVLLFLGPLFEHLPKVILSSIIIFALKNSLMLFAKLPQLYRLSKHDFNIWIFAFCATIFLNVPFGLIIGFIFSLLTVFMRFHSPKFQVLGQLPQTNVYKNIKRYHQAVEIPSIKIFRYDAPIYFANCDNFQEQIFQKCGTDPRKLTDVLQRSGSNVYKQSTQTASLLSEKDNVQDYKTCEKVKFIILDFNSVSYIDNNAIKIMEDIYTLYREIGVFVYLVEPNVGVMQLLAESDFAKETFEQIIFVSIHDAVLRAQFMMLNSDINDN